METLAEIKERYIKVSIEELQKCIECLQSGRLSGIDYAAWSACNIGEHLQKLATELKKQKEL